MLFKLVITLYSVLHICFINSTSVTTVTASNIRCDYANTLKTVSQLQCNAISDSTYACCYLYSDMLDPTGFVNEMCLPISVQNYAYPERITVGGLSFKAWCPPPISGANLPVNYKRGTRCGPSVTYLVLDCALYSYDQNTCCLAKYQLTSDPEKFNLSCVFYGSKFDKTSWKLTLGLTDDFQITKIGKMTLECSGNIIRIAAAMTMLIVLLIY